MHSWQFIQETIEYIETHYSEVITIDQLASIAHLSKYYYQQLFYRLVKKRYMNIYSREDCYIV